MSKPFEVERHDYVTNRLQTLIGEMEKSLERVRSVLSDSLERQMELRRERDQLKTQLEIVTTRLNNLLEPKL